MPKTSKTLTYYEAIGRRKSAIARVRLYLSAAKTKGPKHINADVSKGDIYINNMPIKDYFPSEIYEKNYNVPLELTDSLKRFSISIIARGGGKHGQMEAVKLGLARALEKVDGSYRSILKPEGLLTRDARVRERRKVGTGGRARRQKQSPKR